MVMCTDLDKYVQEVDPAKKSLLLVNKADLLTTKQRYKKAIITVLLIYYSLYSLYLCI
jgi:ribosome biogenesis GTPase A